MQLIEKKEMFRGTQPIGNRKALIVPEETEQRIE